MQILGWVVALALAVVVGFSSGNSMGKSSERADIANECRQAGAFSNKRTGFKCEVIK